LLSSYLDDEVTPEERQEIETLLRRDPEARALAEDLRRARDLLRALPERPLPEGFVEEVLRRASTEREPGFRFLWTVRDLFRSVRARTVLVAAAVCAVLVLGIGPLLRTEWERLRAAEVGVEFVVREHTVLVSRDPLTDRAYLGVVLTDTNLQLAGEHPRAQGQEARR
jgi:anti-sigma factor RsiW